MQGISLRQIVSLLTLYLFILVFLTGVVLYIVPTTRIANDLQWTILGLSKSEYIRMHTVLSLIFLLVTLMHAWYNRSALWRYLCFRQAGVKSGWRLEAVLALCLTVLLVSLIWLNVPPVNKIMLWGESFKASWGGQGGQGRGHKRITLTADHTLAVWANEEHQNVKVFLDKLTQRGWQAKENQTLKEIAKQNGVSLDEVIQALQ